MFKQINIILCFLLLFSFERAIGQDNFDIFVPDFISANTSFDISIITSKKFPDADRLDIFLSPDISLIVTRISLITPDQNSRIPTTYEFIEEFNEQFQKISIDLTDTSHFSNNSFFQLIITLKSINSTQNNLKLFGKFIKGKDILGYLTNSDLKNISDTDYPYNLTFDYYQKFSIADKSLLLVQDAYLNIPLVYNFEETMVAEFWMKIKNPVPNFLEVINWESNRVEYSLSLNEHQMIIVNSSNDDHQPSNLFFVSQNAWYHFKINFNKKNSELSFYCDEKELAHFKVYNDLDFENLVLHFENESVNAEINLEQFRLIRIEQNTLAVERNKNYIDYTDDESEVILQLNFNELELNDLLSKKTLSSEKVRFVKSGAPLFPRSPEIEVKLSENFYEIQWEGGSYNDASKYILERASGENDFIEIDQIVAENNEQKIYSLVSEKAGKPEIVYFRIKQINKDGSVIYSDVVKVGQGMVEDVIIGQNYPNPFNPTTLIQFELIQDTDVEVKVYNLAGKEISRLHEGFLSKGLHQFEFDASGLSSGLYFYQITTPLTSQTRKMILAK